MQEEAPPLLDTLTLKPTALEEMEETVGRWMYGDTDTVVVMMAAYLANWIGLFEGSPCWLMIVGPSGGGKTEMLRTLSELPKVFEVSTLSEAGLLSGTKKDEQQKDSTGGLLRQIGKFGIIVNKDFTSIISTHHEKKSQVLSALREIYDGSWTRVLGTDGGRSYSWEGKIGMIAGSTAAIDSAHSVTSTMGERFIYWRMSKTNPKALSARAIGNMVNESKMREELKSAVKGFYYSLNLTSDGGLILSVTDPERDWLSSLSTMIAAIRSGVERDNYYKDIEFAYEESPTRIAQELLKIYCSMKFMGVGNPRAMHLTTKIGFDSAPRNRVKVFKELVGLNHSLTVAQVMNLTNLPESTTKRVLEDLEQHNVVSIRRNNFAFEYEITPMFKELYREVSSGFLFTIQA